MTPQELIELWCAATTDDSRDKGIMFALLSIARRHPQWFDPELVSDPLQMLFEAIAEAQDDMVSRKLIEAAYWLVKANEDRLADPQPNPEPLPITDDPLKRLYRCLLDAHAQRRHYPHLPPYWGELLTAAHEAAFPAAEADPEAESQRQPDPLKRLYRCLVKNVTPGVAGDVMQMPPSWGELLTAVHEAAFPDGDDSATVTSSIEVEKRIAYAKGRDAGYDEGRDFGYDVGHAAGYRLAALRYAGGGEA